MVSDRRILALSLPMMFLLLTTAFFTTVSANNPPVADAGEGKEVKVGDTVLFGGGGSSDPDGDSLSYSWDFDASDGIQKDSKLLAPTHVYNKAGAYSVTLTVSDGTDGSTDTITIKVNPNFPPVVDLGDDLTAAVNEWVFFDTRNTTDANGDAMTYSWDFDASDGIQEESTEKFVQMQFSNARKYTVTLTVCDGEHTVNGTVNVTVSAGMEPIPGKKYDGGGILAPGQKNVYMVPLSRGKGLTVTIQAKDGKLSYYTFESKHFFKFTETGDIVAINGASKENANKLSYSIKASKTDEYYIVVLNPQTAQATVEYTINIKTVPADQANGPGFSGVELVIALAVGVTILVLRRKSARAAR